MVRMQGIHWVALGLAMGVGCAQPRPSYGPGPGTDVLPDETPSETGDSGTETTVPADFPDVCDGSEEIRFYIGDWVGGAAEGAVDQLMYAEGTRYLKIDGRCHFYVYDGETRTHRWWEPVREGDLTESELLDVLTRLQVHRWAQFDASDLAGNGPYYEEWQRFEVAGQAYECSTGCSAGGAAREVIDEARRVIPELAARGTAVDPETIEVTVVHWPWTDPERLDVTMPWGAQIPMEDLVEDPSQAWAYRDPELIGTFLSASEGAWFLQAREEYLQIMTNHPPSAIGIIEPNASEDLHLLWIRTVVP